MRIELIASEKGFVVTKEGILLNKKGIKVGSKANTGYITHNIRFGKKFKYFCCHRLQAYQKYGIKMFEKGLEVRHKNGNELDNSFDNILIGTHSENMMDIPENVRMEKSIHASSFIRKYDRQEIIEFHTLYKSYKKTMDHFNISSKGTLHFILNG